MRAPQRTRKSACSLPRGRDIEADRVASLTGLPDRYSWIKSYGSDQEVRFTPFTIGSNGGFDREEPDDFPEDAVVYCFPLASKRDITRLILDLQDKGREVPENGALQRDLLSYLRDGSHVLVAARSEESRKASAFAVFRTSSRVFARVRPEANVELNYDFEVVEEFGLKGAKLLVRALRATAFSVIKADLACLLVSAEGAGFPLEIHCRVINYHDATLQRDRAYAGVLNMAQDLFWEDYDNEFAEHTHFERAMILKL